ncbi:MAG: hypothetical protein GXO43_02155 [Crenarchaeota archaeon]|nr:hypothetical protein [Thermoproteota archaeon]
MLRIYYSDERMGGVIREVDVLGMDAMYYKDANMIHWEILTGNREIGKLEFDIGVYRDVVKELMLRYKLGDLSISDLNKLNQKNFKLIMDMCSLDIIKWLLDRVFGEVQYSIALYDFKKDDYLSTDDILDVSGFVVKNVAELFLYSTVLPYMNDELDERSVIKFIQAKGVDAFLEEMKKRYKVEEKEVQINVERMTPEMIDEVTEMVKEKPVSIEEITMATGLPASTVKEILKSEGAVQDKRTGKWYIPSETKADEAYKILVDYATMERTSIISVDDAIRVLTEAGFTSNEASAYLSYLNSEGRIEIRNGLVEIPEVKNRLMPTVGNEEEGESKEYSAPAPSKPKMNKTEKEKLFDEVRKIARAYVEGKISVEEAIDVLVEGVDYLNKTTYTSMCRVYMNTIRDLSAEKYEEISSTIKRAFGTVSCAKLYDKISAIAAREKAGESDEERESEEQPLDIFGMLKELMGGGSEQS